MQRLTQFALPFLKSEDGPTAVEYGVMLALIIVPGAPGAPGLASWRR
jgi:hypothetical protein